MLQIIEIRRLLKYYGLDSFIIPNNDEFNNEYLPDAAKRLEYATNFSGSAGTAIITHSRCAFFTDGRYTLQAAAELDPKFFQIFNISEKRPVDWIRENNLKTGFDPWQFSLAEVKKFPRNMQPCSNLVDEIWKKRPEMPSAPAYLIPPGLAGKTSTQKRAELCEGLAADMVLLTTADSVNWLLNLRGGDIPHTPFCLAYAALHKSGEVELFIDKRKVPAKLVTSLENVKIRDFGEVMTLGEGKTVQLDPARTPYALFLALQNNGAETIEKTDPCQLPKALKNPVEIAGIRKAHEIDGKALTRFLQWLPTQNSLDEIKAEEKLREFRRENPEYVEDSFSSISGFGYNGAIVHYRASEASNRQFANGSLYLIDSGGQYMGGGAFGTTDVTRTIVVGEPNYEMVHNYTLVLKGHIALASAVFPYGTTGAQLDALARQFLWAEGKDYDHGTGHGVGCFLSVHEGPQGISRRYTDIPLRPGMVLSNEPGYYKAGEYGIRIENLVLVVEAEPAYSNPLPNPLPQGEGTTSPPSLREGNYLLSPSLREGVGGGSKNQFLRFETLTKAPFDENLIEWELLTAAEKQWIQDYYASFAR